MDFISMSILAISLAWASGINVYAVFVILGFGSMAGFFELPQGLDFVVNPLVLSVAVIMFFIEFIVDKIPIIDSSWDSFHTFIRVSLGAFLASKVFGDESFAFLLLIGFIGAFISATSHALKSGSRVVVNSSPEPFSNITLSFIEDLMVFGGIFLAFKYPIIFLTFFVAYTLVFIWIAPKIWRGVKKIFKFLSNTDEKDRNVKGISLNQKRLKG